MTIALNYAARSDVGLVRSNNQDSGYAGAHLLIVADGMGGHAGGDVASSVAVAKLAQLEADTPASDLVSTLENAILDANQAIMRRAKDEPQLAGLGTTVTAILRSENKCALAHIGDSRAYLMRDHKTTQLTKDHTFVQRLIDEGRLTEEEAERHPQRSMIMRVLGDRDATPELDLSLRPTLPGDRWMLCSDGLSGLISFDTISQLLATISDPEECAEQLVQLALKAGGPDNITCVIADVVELESLPKGVNLTKEPQIVGSAAIDRNRPTTASGPAAKAAALTKATQSNPAYEDEDFEEQPPRRATWPLLVLAGLVTVLLAVAGYLAYGWTQEQFYVGTDGKNVVLYRGLPQDLGPISLSSPQEVTDISIENLRPVTKTQVTNTVSANNLADAKRIIAQLREEAQSNLEDAKSNTSTDTSGAETNSDNQSTESDGGR